MRTADVDSRIAPLLGKFTPAIEQQLIEARANLRAFFPRGFELVYDNYNALVFAISPTDRTPDAFISVAGYPKWVTLFFLHGTALRDPGSLLEGTGKQVRSIRLASPEDLHAPAVKTLIEQAILPHRPALERAPGLATIIKTVADKQRPRRPAKPMSHDSK